MLGYLFENINEDGGSFLISAALFHSLIRVVSASVLQGQKQHGGKFWFTIFLSCSLTVKYISQNHLKYFGGSEI